MRGWHGLCYFRGMKRLIPLVLVVVVGCKKEPEPDYVQLHVRCFHCIFEMEYLGTVRRDTARARIYYGTDTVLAKSTVPIWSNWKGSPVSVRACSLDTIFTPDTITTASGTDSVVMRISYPETHVWIIVNNVTQRPSVLDANGCVSDYFVSHD